MDGSPSDRGLTQVKWMEAPSDIGAQHKLSQEFEARKSSHFFFFVNVAKLIERKCDISRDECQSI